MCAFVSAGLCMRMKYVRGLGAEPRRGEVTVMNGSVSLPAKPTVPAVGAMPWRGRPAAALLNPHIRVP